MRKRSKIMIAAAATAAVAAAAGTGIAAAGGVGGDDDATEVSISGAALEKASASALDHAGDGRVTGTEVGDEESYYEVEVTHDDGSQEDVQLDRDFNVVGTEADDAGEDAG